MLQGKKLWTATGQYIFNIDQYLIWANKLYGTNLQWNTCRIQHYALSMSTVSSPLTLCSVCSNTYARSSNERWWLSSYLRATSLRQCMGLLQAHGWGCSHYPWSYALDPAAGAWAWSDATHALKTGTQEHSRTGCTDLQGNLYAFQEAVVTGGCIHCDFFPVFCPPRSPMISAQRNSSRIEVVNYNTVKFQPLQG